MDQRKASDQQPSPESNQSYLRQHQADLCMNYPSCDLSEMSYQTEQTDFAGSRHSSLNTEPLTLDADQIHDAKDQAVDVLQHVGPDKAVEIFTHVDPDKAVEIFTKDSLNSGIGKVSMMEYYWRHGQDLETRSEAAGSQEAEAEALAKQINSLVEKAQQVVEANEKHSQSMAKISGAPAVSLEEQSQALPKGGESLSTSPENDVKMNSL